MSGVDKDKEAERRDGLLITFLVWTVLSDSSAFDSTLIPILSVLIS